MAKNCVFLYVESMPSSPIVGNINTGTTAKTLIAASKSGFLRMVAIKPEKKNSNNEKTVPSNKNKMDSLLIKLFAWLGSTRGKK